MITIFLILVIIILIPLLIVDHISYINDEIKEFNNELWELKGTYISYHNMKRLLEDYEDVRKLIIIPLNRRMKNFVYSYKHISEIIDAFNEEFLGAELAEYKEYFDNLFEYPLDDEVRKAIIADDNNMLIVAGAGAGKTTTIIGKTKFLIDKKNVEPNEILTISFTKTAKDSLVIKLNDDNVRRVRCTTFDRLAKEIIGDNESKKEIVNDEYLYQTIREYLSEEIKKDPAKSSHLISLYACYLHNQNSIDKDFSDVIELERGCDLETLKCKYYKIKDLKTLRNEKVKNIQELIIANYLFVHGINYKYEQQYKHQTKSYTYKQYHPDFYLPDYDAYIEHFEIDEDGRALQYNEYEEKLYLDGIRARRTIHERYQTKLIETYSYDFDNYKIEEVLKEKLKSCGVKFKDIDYQEAVDVISKIDNEEMTSFYELIAKFIKMFKGNNYEVKKFDEFYKDSSKSSNIRSMYMLELIKDIYIYYQDKLSKDNYIDFDDMLNQAADKIDRGFNEKISYIIIDEFQDLSYSRYRLIKTLQERTDAKIVAVGDDWQSIYHNQGCNLNYFINFENYFKDPKIMHITNTYRNCQNLVDIADSFIMKNEKAQIKKEITSKKSNIESPIEFYYYKTNIYSATESAVRFLAKNFNCQKIAVLGRNNSDVERYGYKKDPNKKEIDMSSKFNYNVIFTTIHKAKGLEYDGVILCNMDNYIAGFPNKMSDDGLLNYLTDSQTECLYEEERRLLYVALTRTKTKCIALIPIVNPSSFALELCEMSNNMIPKRIIEDDEHLHNPKCPKCDTGILISKENKRTHSVFAGCSNYPKCNFAYKETSILKGTMKCPKCGSRMIKRKGVNSEFYSCTNYPYCNQTIESKDYLKYKTIRVPKNVTSKETKH